MAEALLKEKSDSIQVKSAGIFAAKQMPAAPDALKALHSHGISFQHYSQPVTRELLEWADVILTMTTQHKQSLLQQYSQFSEKIFTLKEYVDDEQTNIWNKLKEAYTELEEKRLKLLRNNLTNAEIEQQLQEDITKIRLLESKMDSVDIQDPIGQGIDVYEKTLAELEKNIELLINKLENKDK
ncbi:low molecular weight protein arginine phosphatase [Salirhabdus salicampi]|nr:low molecular weight protein arginine phosphatase [Salirhabdus salicampi]